MKKKLYLFFSMAITLSMSLNAQTSVTLSSNAVKSLSFDHIIAGKPFGWYLTNNKAGSSLTAIQTANRTKENNKAWKFTAVTGGATGLTWHTNAALASGGWTTQSDYSPMSIDLGKDFFITFWAKAESGTPQLHLGPTDLYNGQNFNGITNWSNPSIELTTNWTKYAIVFKGTQTDATNLKEGKTLTALTTLQLQFRSDMVVHIDDMEIFYGGDNDLPDNVGNYFINGVEYDKGGITVGINEYQSNTPEMKIYVQGNNLIIKSDFDITGNIYTIDGKLLKTIKINTGINTISGLTKGVYILNGNKFII